MQKLSSRIIILIVIKGVIQQLHCFAPTPPLCGQLLYRELEHKMPLLTPPPSSRPHSYWMAPNILDPQDRKSHYPPDLSVHCHVSLSSCGSTSAARAAAAAAPPPSCAAYSYAVMTKGEFSCFSNGILVRILERFFSHLPNFQTRLFELK